MTFAPQDGYQRNLFGGLVALGGVLIAAAAVGIRWRAREVASPPPTADRGVRRSRGWAVLLAVLAFLVGGPVVLAGAVLALVLRSRPLVVQSLATIALLTGAVIAAAAVVGSQGLPPDAADLVTGLGVAMLLVSASLLPHVGPGDVARWPLGAGFPVDFAVATVVSLVVLGPLVLLPGYSLTRGHGVRAGPAVEGRLARAGRRAAPRRCRWTRSSGRWRTVVPVTWCRRRCCSVTLLVGGVGAGRLVARRAGSRPGPPRSVLFLWNPWVAERLSIGQWAIVAGYAALPWVALAARRVRDDVRRGWPYLGRDGGSCAVCSPSAAVMGGWWCSPSCVLAAPVACLGVATATVVSPTCPGWSLGVAAGGVGRGRSSSSFAARAETAAGLVASVLSLGGIWKSSVVPGERTRRSSCWPRVAVTLIAIVGLRAGRGDRRLRGALVAVGVISFAAAYCPAWPSRRRGSAMRARRCRAGPAARLAPVPGAGRAHAAAGLRRGRPWLAERRRPGREAMVVLAGVVALLPVLLLPSLAWGLAGKLRSVVVPARVGHRGRDPRVRGRRPDHRAAVVRELPRVRVEPRPGDARPGAALPARPGADRRLPGARRHGSAAGERRLGCGRAGARVSRPGRGAPRLWASGRCSWRRTWRLGRRCPPGRSCTAVLVWTWSTSDAPPRSTASGPPRGGAGRRRAGHRGPRCRRGNAAGSTAAHPLVTQDWAGWSQVGYAASPDVSLLVSTCMLPPPDQAWEGPS